MVKNQKIETGYIDSKIGKITILYTVNQIIQLSFNHNNYQNEQKFDVFTDIYSQIQEYLSGRRKNFNLEYSLPESEFARTVLEEISCIPYGETATYKQIAVRVGRPKAYRAVGSVCAKNKLPIIIPCHRVIHSDGSLGNYIGGLELKEALLNLENMFKLY